MTLGIFLLVGTIAMFFPIWHIGKKRGLTLWKNVLISILLTISGTVGTLIMYFVETGGFGGISFFGAVFLVPIMFMLIAPLLKVPYREVMDQCAVGECIMLALMKIHCILGGCCKGRILFTKADYTVIRFPSREVEMAVALLIFAVLFYWFIKGKKQGQLYPWYLVIYGVLRFGLNLLREHPKDMKFPLPNGNIWSIVAIVIGVVWLLIIYYRKTDKQYQEFISQQQE